MEVGSKMDEPMASSRFLAGYLLNLSMYNGYTYQIYSHLELRIDANSIQPGQELITVHITAAMKYSVVVYVDLVFNVRIGLET